MPEAKHFANSFCQVAFESLELTLARRMSRCFVALLPGIQAY